MKLDLSPYRGRRVCVALSGGGDSLALFDYLNKNAAAAGIALSAVHVEHGIRGASSLADAAFVAALCGARGVPLESRAADIPALAAARGEGLEAAARRFRYALFAALLAEDRADFVFTAHHAADNAESVLFNLFRGAALTGAGGMRAFIPAAELIAQFLPDGAPGADLEGKGVARPLLGVPKAEIQEYLRENGLQGREDETNADESYTRNFLRRRVLASAKQVFPACESRLYEFSRAAREDDEFLYSLAARALRFDAFDGAYKVDLSAPRPLFFRACMVALRGLGVQADYARVNLEDLASLARGENGKTLALPGGVRAAREYDVLALYLPRPRAAAEYAFGVGEFCFGRIAVRVRSAAPGAPLEGRGEELVRSAAGFARLAIDAAALPEGSVLRLRREGDRFEKFGGGRRKLKDFLIERKIPRRLRDELPVLACGSQVYAVCGVEISEKVKLGAHTSERLTIEVYHKGDS